MQLNRRKIIGRIRGLLRTSTNTGESSIEVADKEFLLLIDETGTDGRTSNVAYVGCLLETSDVDSLTSQIELFNQAMLDIPRFADSGIVKIPHEARHFVEDHFTLRERFFEEIINRLPMRIYIVSDVYTASNLEETKIKLMNRLLAVAPLAKRIDNLNVIAEASSKSFDGQFPNVQFENKEYLPLSIADYVAGAIRGCYEIIAKAQRGESVVQKKNSFDVQFYLRIENMIAYEEDMSTHTIGSRRNRIIGNTLRNVIQ